MVRIHAREDLFLKDICFQMKISSHIIWRKIEGNIFIIDSRNNYLYELNETASLIFEYLINGFAKEKIIEKLMHLYEVDRKTLINDVDETISYLIKEGIYE